MQTWEEKFASKYLAWEMAGKHTPTLSLSLSLVLKRRKQLHELWLLLQVLLELQRMGKEGKGDRYLT